MKIIKRTIFIILIILVSVGVLFVGNGYDMYKKAIEDVPLQKKVEEIQTRKNYTHLSELPQMYIDAIISVEDHRFYKHKGIDIISIGRAVKNDIKAKGFIEGGSTITQQIAKNEYFTQEKKMTRKVAEVFVAIEIEKNYKKDEILELYINTIYFGSGYYNVKDASMGYFGKIPKDMTDGECIMLAGIPNAPSVYSPLKNPKLAKQRQKQVIDKMVKYKYLTEEQAQKIINEK